MRLDTRVAESQRRKDVTNAESRPECASPGALCDVNPSLVPGSRASLHGDFDVLAEHQQEAHQALQREAGETPTDEGGYLGLIDAQQFGRLHLGQSFVLDEHGDLVGKLGFGQGLLRIRQAQIGENVSTAEGVMMFTFWNRYFSRFWSISMARCRRCFTRSMTLFGVAMPCFDFF